VLAGSVAFAEAYQTLNELRNTSSLLTAGFHLNTSGVSGCLKRDRFTERLKLRLLSPTIQFLAVRRDRGRIGRMVLTK
jgi:hypothetical protein